jgi:glyceraldehyde-3-phosphate dehydrogenase (NADP+)
MESKKILVGGGFTDSSQQLEVIDPWTDKAFARTYSATRGQLEEAVHKANEAERAMAALSSYEKEKILEGVSRSLLERQEELVHTICREAGKPYKFAKAEAARAAQTFHVAAEEAKRRPKEYLDLDWTPSGTHKEALVDRSPIGTIAGITPFNFPLNLVAHKIAPAIAAGCPIVLKPDERTPLSALLLGELIVETELPEGGLSIVPTDRETGNMLVTDEDIAMLSFTGSPRAGWEMKKNAGKKKVVLELGGNAGTVVCDDSDPGHAIDRCVFGGFVYAGQVCIHAQRILVEANIFEEFERRFVKEVGELSPGAPQDPGTDISAMIDDASAERVEEWIQEARSNGAKVLAGGKREGRFIQPTVLTNTDPSMKVNCEEVFGPVVTIEPFNTFEEALNNVNDSRYGLQAGLFTKSQPKIDHAFRTLQVGGVVVNDVPAFRVDHMPYGGVKDSGFGREGLKYAIQEMTEPRILIKPTDEGWG